MLVMALMRVIYKGWWIFVRVRKSHCVHEVPGTVPGVLLFELSPDVVCDRWSSRYSESLKVLRVLRGASEEKTAGALCVD